MIIIIMLVYTRFVRLPASYGRIPFNEKYIFSDESQIQWWVRRSSCDAIKQNESELEKNKNLDALISKLFYAETLNNIEHTVQEI